MLPGISSSFGKTPTRSYTVYTLRTKLLRTPRFWITEGFGDAPIKFAHDHRYILVKYIFRLTVTRLDASIME